MKNKLKAWLTRNIGMKLVSIVIAFLVWVTIINMNDPVVTRTISGIRIERRNAELVSSGNTTYVADMGDDATISIRISGVRSKIEDLNASDFVAYVDFREMSQLFAVPIHVEPTNETVADIVEITKQSATVMTGNIEEKEENTLDIDVRMTGVPDHYFARCSDKSAKSLNISGSKNVMKTIARLVAVVNVEGSTSNIRQKEVKLKAVDKNGEEVAIELPIKTILVDIDILPVEEKEVVVNTTNISAATGFGIANITWTKTVSVAGTKDALAGLDKIEVRYQALNLMPGDEKCNGSIPLENYLPDGIYPATQDDVISIIVVVERQSYKTFTVATSEITVRNLQPQFTCEIAEKSIEFTIQDLNAQLVDVTEENLGLYVDLAGVLEEGNFTANLHSTNEVVERSLQRSQSVSLNVTVTASSDDRS
ncbi:MAG: hypothetical protein IKX54_04500 [Lachnospiraceae bacterium]|nr:hypothetical protein [Lachnospiraceae bacterium]